MKNSAVLRILSLALIIGLLSFLPIGPLSAADLNNLGNDLTTGAIQQGEVAPSCPGGTCPTSSGGLFSAIASSCSGGGGLFSGITQGIGNLFGGGGGGFFKNLFGGIFDAVKNIFSGIKNLFSGGGGGLLDGIKNIIGGGGGGGGIFGGGNDGGGGGPIDSTPIPDTPGVTPNSPGSMPANGALAQEIRAKFGITMQGGWNQTQLRAVYKSLTALPEGFRKYNRSMSKEGWRGGLLGMGQVGGQGRIWIYGGAFNSYAGTGIGTIVHEIGHNFQGYNGAVMSKWSSTVRRGNYGGVGATRGSVSSYGNTNAGEDFCESIRFYFCHPAQMKQSHPARYKFIKENVMSNVEFTGNEWK